MKVVAVLFGLVVGIGSPERGCAQNIFSDFAGGWIGQGKLATDIDGPMRSALCRSTVRLIDTDNLIIDGICAVGSGRSDYSLTLRRDEGGRVSAKLSTAGIGSDLSYSGVEKDGQFNLRAYARVSVDHDLTNVVFELSLAPLTADEFELHQVVTKLDAGDESPNMALVFRRDQRAKQQ